jgi:hypothetical protein
MATVSWAAPESTVSYLTTELNSLANAANKLGGEIDNATGLYRWLSIELVLASLTPTSGGRVNVYLIPSVDATNYADGGDSLDPTPEYLLTVLYLDTATAAKRKTAHNLPIPPLKFKLLIENVSGVSFAAASNTVKYRRYNESVA